MTNIGVHHAAYDVRTRAIGSGSCDIAGSGGDGTAAYNNIVSGGTTVHSNNSGCCHEDGGKYAIFEEVERGADSTTGAAATTLCGVQVQLDRCFKVVGLRWKK